MAVPFRIGVMQLTMEPLDEMLASARAMDEAGMDTVWLAEAYPWWRKHQMEARGSTVVSALMARETTSLTIGWGIISPYTRHPVQVAMDARVVQEAAGPGRFIVGFGTSKIFLNNTKQGGPPKVTKPLAHMRDSVEIVRGILGGERFEYDGKVFSADIPALSDEAHAPRWDVPVYVAGTAPMMQQLGGEIGDGLLTPSITTPDFVRYTAREHPRGRGEVGPRSPRTSTSAARSSPRSTRPTATRGRDGAREIGGMYLANKVQNIQGSADVLLELGRDRAGRDRPGRGGDGAAAAASRRRRRSPTRCSTSASRSRGRRATASRRSRSTATPAARTSCSSSGARTGSSRSASSARRCSRTSGTRERGLAVRRRRPRPARRDGGPDDRRLELHGRRAGDGRADGRALPRARAPRAVAAGRGRPRERARHVARRGRRQDADVQRPHGHVVLGPRGVAARRARLPAGTLRRGRPPLRARDLEHEGRARVLRRGGARAPGRRRAAAGRRDDRRRLRRDREDAVRRRAAAPSTAATRPARATSSPTAASPTCACSASRPRARSCSATSARSGCGSACTATSSTRRSARASATRTRSCACTRCSRPCRSGSRPGRTTRRTATAARRRSSTSARSRAASAGASRGRRTTPTCSSTSACRRRSRWASRGARCSTWCAGSRSASRTTGSRARSTSRRPGAEIDEGHELVAAIDASHEEVFGERPGRDVTRWFSDASALTRYGIPTVNYGTSTGLMDVEQGREPRDRRPRADGRGVREGRDARLRRRVSLCRISTNIVAERGG